MDKLKYNPVQTNQMPFREKLKNISWRMINVSVFRLIPPYTSFFKKCRVFLLRIWGAEVAWSVTIHPSANIEYPWNLSIGHLSSLGPKSWIYAMNKITIGEKTCIGKEAYLITGSHNIASYTFNLITSPINIGDNVWIATGAYVLPNVIIEDNSVIAAGSVVVKNIEQNSVVGGNPAKFIKKREVVC